jgi:hypothetical protein
MRVIRHRYVEIILLGLSAIFVLLAIFLEVQLTYVASANTEYVLVESINHGESQWYIENADIKQSDCSQWQTFSGTIIIPSPVRIYMTRISEGPLWIEIEGNNENNDQIISELYPIKENKNLIGKNSYVKKSFTIKIMNLMERSKRGQTIVLPVDGYMEIGRIVGNEIDGKIPVLKSGKIQMIGKKLIGHDTYDAGTKLLNIGDVFKVDKPKVGKGLVVVNQQPGLNVVSYILGERAYIRRFGGVGYKVSSSLWVRFEKDPAITILLTVVLFMLGVFAKWRQWRAK